MLIDLHFFISSYNHSRIPYKCYMVGLESFCCSQNYTFYKRIDYFRMPLPYSTRSRHSLIDGHVPLLATANVLSLLIPGSSWSLGNHPGWHVCSLGRRPLSVSGAVGSPVHSSDGTLTGTSSAPPLPLIHLQVQGYLPARVPARRALCAQGEADSSGVLNSLRRTAR